MFISRLASHPDITNMGAKEIRWWNNEARHSDEIYELERYLDIADIGADKVMREATMTKYEQMMHPIIFGDATPSTIFGENRWKRYVIELII